MYCKNCGTKIEGGKFCPECGARTVTTDQIHEKKVELMNKYADKIKKLYTFHVKGSIPSKKISNAILNFAPNLDRTKIIGFYDLTVFESGKDGIIFTDDGIYYKAINLRPGKWNYADIDYAWSWLSHVIFLMKNGDHVEWRQDYCNPEPLAEFINELLKLDEMYGGEKNKEESTLEILQKYSGRMASSFDFYLQGTIPPRKFANALSSYARNASGEIVVGLYDTTLTGSAKEGIVFTETGMYQNIEDKCSQLLRYAMIERAECDRYTVIIRLKDGSVIEWHAYLEAESFAGFLNAMSNRTSNEQKTASVMTKADILKKYGRRFNSHYRFYAHNETPYEKLKAASKIGCTAPVEDIVGIYEYNDFLSDSDNLYRRATGIVFTKDAMYQNMEEKLPAELCYADIKTVEKTGKYDLKIVMKDNTVIEGYLSSVERQPLADCLNAMAKKTAEEKEKR